MNTVTENYWLIYAAATVICRRLSLSYSRHSSDIFINLQNLLFVSLINQLCFIFLIVRFTACLAYFGLAFGATNFGGNMYVNFALSGLVEIPGSVFSIFTLNR